MFPTFSGNTRRRPQVNLSGRGQNPFAQSSPGGGIAKVGHVGPSDGREAALVSAQQDRLARQQERERTKAATLVQSRWRGNVARKALRRTARRRWDGVEEEGEPADVVMGDEGSRRNQSMGGPLQPYSSYEGAVSQLHTLLYFVDPRDSEDLARVQRFHSRWTKVLDGRTGTIDQVVQGALFRLIERCIESIDTSRAAISRSESQLSTTGLGAILQDFVAQCTDAVAHNAISYYSKLQIMQERAYVFSLPLVLVPLQQPRDTALEAYRGFARAMLTSELRIAIGKDAFRDLLTKLDYKLLGEAIGEDIEDNRQSLKLKPLRSLGRQNRLCLLSHFIYVYRETRPSDGATGLALEYTFVRVVGYLLSSLVDEIDIEPAFSDDDNEARSRQDKIVDHFEKAQITSLVDQQSIRGLLTMVGDRASGSKESNGSQSIRLLVGYVLTLIRLFPRRANEIRMWLYMGQSSDQSQDERLPVINYFWKAIQRPFESSQVVDVFGTVAGSPYKVVDLLKQRPEQPSSRSSTRQEEHEVDDQWRLILLFMELYNFVLLIMDDDEFFRDGKNGQNSRTLTFRDIENLIAFLKNLGFTMYYQAPEITGGPSRADAEEDLSKLFRSKRDSLPEVSSAESQQKERPISIAGVQEVTLEYVKGLVTGLLRQLYSRDSRRSFLPKGTWLLGPRLDMTNFIDSVVEEEERRRTIESEDEAEESGTNGVSDDPEGPTRPIIGTRGQNSTSRYHQVIQQQRQASRKRYLEAVAPRQQILQNMPFLIPFTTRVQIFRRFVQLDQMKRRNGLDADLWQHMNPSRARHHAQIRREHEFEDAFKQYYSLGAALKEPIQITFVDRFGAVEAGIDGGGVTKEFLTSVTNQVFSQTGGVQLFVENDQHLFYPNPSALDETREVLREAGLTDDDPDHRTQMMEMLNRYEFLGRIIGKTLYEGVLIDIGFLGSFLLKWALTGGIGSAPRESGYRASLNDLRDYDEGLYQGLLKLKNYIGNVEDFALNFTIADTLNIPGHSTSKTIIRDLKRGGSQMSVTNANRLVYIQDVARHRLQSQPMLQTNAFLRGLSSIIEPSWLSMFNQSELQTLIGGARQSINVPDLRKNTIYGGIYTIGDDGLEHPSIKMFWDVMEGFSDDDRGKVLKFVTSTPRAPLLGFSSLNPRFSIRDGGSDVTRLPSTSTCVNLLKLPKYLDAKTLKMKLLQAVNSGAGFDLS